MEDRKSPAPRYPAEISRKVLHLGSATLPAVYLFVARPTMLWLLAGCIGVAVVVEILRQVQPAFRAFFMRTVGFMLRPTEWHRVTGSTYVLIGALLSVWLFPKPIAIAVMMIQVVSDTAASLVGLRFGRTRFLGKSLAGSGAFFITAVVIMWIAMPASRALGLLAALVATVAEALPALKLGPVELNDNLTIPLATGLVLHWLA
jgi:dolichol kinase